MICPIINIWAALVAAVAFWALGALWYSPLLFGKRWQKEVGLSEETIKKANMAVVFGLSFVLMFLMVMGMSITLRIHHPEDVTWLTGLGLGIFIAIFFAMAATGINYLYQRRSLTLWLIDGFYLILGLALAGIIIGSWK